MKPPTDAVALLRMIAERWAVAECVRRQMSTTLANRQLVSARLVELIDGGMKMPMGDFMKKLGKPQMSES